MITPIITYYVRIHNNIDNKYNNNDNNNKKKMIVIILVCHRIYSNYLSPSIPFAYYYYYL